MARSSKGYPQLPALTSIRGLAAWWVVLYHFREHFPSSLDGPFEYIINKGYLGVDLFFEMSGFVIALNYYKSFDKKFNLQEYRNFLIVRIARIYPLHLFIMLIFIINPVAIWAFSSHRIQSGAYNITYFFISMVLLQNWGFTENLDWNIPSWSISTEWFVYIIFPLMVAISQKFMRSILATGSGIIVLLLSLYIAGDLNGGLGADIPRFGLIRCVLEFSIGVLLFRGWLSLRYQGRVWALLLAGSAAIVFGLYAYFSLADFIAVPLGFALLIAAISLPDGLPARLLALPVLERMGLISYSTYLVHFFVRDWVKFLMVTPGPQSVAPTIVYIAATFIGSVVLYRTIEVPGRTILRRLVEVPRPVELTASGVLEIGPR